MAGPMALRRSFELMEFAARNRYLRESILELDGTGLSPQVIVECLELGGLGVPLGEMLSLLADVPSVDDENYLAGLLASRARVKSQQLALLRVDAWCVGAVLKLAELRFPDEAVLVKSLIDQLRADALNCMADQPAARQGSMESRPSTCDRAYVGLPLGYQLMEEARRRGLVFRHLNPLVMSEGTTASTILSVPYPVRTLPSSALRAAEDLELAAEGSGPATDRLYSHMLEIGGQGRTTSKFLAAVIGKLRATTSRSEVGREDLTWHTGWFKEEAPRLTEPLATVVLLGQVIAFWGYRPRAKPVIENPEGS